MSPEPDLPVILSRLGHEPVGPAIDVLGPTIEFITGPSGDDSALCVMRGVIPPGVTVPLHSHDDPEDFYIIEGSADVLTQGAGGLEWARAHAGDYVRIPPGTPHAHRNATAAPLVDIVISTAKMGRFFQEIGRPADGTPPAAQDLGKFAATAAKYGYVLGTPGENAAAGIELPTFAVE